MNAKITKSLRRFARQPKSDAPSEAGNTKCEETPADKAAAIPASAPSAPRPESKVARIIGLLTRTGGASLDELVAATGWQPHTTRATLTGLRKKGHTIAKEKVDSITRYLITAPAQS